MKHLLPFAILCAALVGCGGNESSEPGAISPPLSSVNPVAVYMKYRVGQHVNTKGTIAPDFAILETSCEVTPEAGVWHCRSRSFTGARQTARCTATTCEDWIAPR